ncbi:MAG: hypothetical protein NW226_22825 [Microscillaceae bacterium]|nr:hypothetical protein [Microscillaceae bacterium]
MIRFFFTAIWAEKICLLYVESQAAYDLKSDRDTIRLSRWESYWLKLNIQN